MFEKDDVVEFKQGKKDLRGKIMGLTAHESGREYFVMVPHKLPPGQERAAFMILKLDADEMTKVEEEPKDDQEG